MEPLMTIQEATEYLHVSDSTMRRLVRKNWVRSLRIGGPHGLLRFDRQHLIEDLLQTTIPIARVDKNPDIRGYFSCQGGKCEHYEWCSSHRNEKFPCEANRMAKAVCG